MNRVIMLSGPNIDGILSKLSDNDLVSEDDATAAPADDEDPCSWILHAGGHTRIEVCQIERQEKAENSKDCPRSHS